MDLLSRESRQQTPPDRAAVATEATPDEAPVVHGLVSVHKRSQPAGEPERDDVDAGRGIEVGTPKAPRDLDLPPRLEEQRGQRLPGTGTAGEPSGRFTLDHQIGVLRRSIGLDEPPDDGGGPIERNVPEDLVGDIGQSKTQEVGLDDCDAAVAYEALAKSFRQRAVNLDRHNLTAATGQFPGQNTPTWPDLDDQIASFDWSLSDQASRKRPAPQEVL